MATLLEKQSDGSFERYAVVRILLGGILLIAALLKTHQLATEPTAEISLMTSRWFQIFVVEFELLLGLGLVFGLFPRFLWLTTFGLFSLFSCVTLYKAFSGEVSCGCFGAVEVNPWYSFVLDGSAVFALLRWRPNLSGPLAIPSPGKAVSYAAPVLFAWLLIAMPAGWAMVRYEAVQVSDDGQFIGDGEIVILEPENWVGKRFPLIGHIDIGESLQDGEWIVLLYHHDCPHCREVVPEYEQTARSVEGNANTPHIALIEVPPFGPHSESVSAGSLQRGQLAETKDWFVQTPVEIRLAHGEVSSVRSAESFEHEDENSVTEVAQLRNSSSPLASARSRHDEGAKR